MNRDRFLPFTKASAYGNDFLLVRTADLPRGSSGKLAELSRRMCDRHNGIGADGVEWLSPVPKHDIAARLINADGSEAEISGNGTRCVAAYLADRKDRKEFKILTGAGTKICRLLGHRDRTFRFNMHMGAGAVEGERVLDVLGKKQKGLVVSTGNPHFVIFVEEFAPKWQDQAAVIATHLAFPQGTNVELVEVLDRNTIEFRIYERGAGETQSSGTGSCASAIAAIHAGKVGSPVEVRAPGGIQTVKWNTNRELELEGAAVLVCEGNFLL
jgi:diaminopimelate epimerase